MADAVKLRGHHGLCILTHSGAGYTPDFIDNLGTQIERINKGANVEIVSGPDDICAALTKEGAVACDHAKICTKGTVIKTHDLAALKDISHELQIPPLKAGDTLKLGKSEVSHLRKAFAAGSVRRACKGCPWYDACTEVANKNFAGVKLMPKAVPKKPPKVSPGS
ncbi:MAG: DUF1284 domain-containing protein [Alphaproteobacteria bacterium]